MKKMMTEYIRTVLEISDSETADEFIDCYAALLNETLPKMQTACANRDFSELRTLAHTIKGSSANIGAEPLRAASLALQQSADAKNEAECAAHLAELDTLRKKIGD